MEISNSSPYKWLWIISDDFESSCSSTAYLIYFAAVFVFVRIHFSGTLAFPVMELLSRGMKSSPSFPKAYFVASWLER
jgi:hypothetical protein